MSETQRRAKVEISYRAQAVAPFGQPTKLRPDRNPSLASPFASTRTACVISTRRGWFVAIKRFCWSAFYWASARQLGTGGLTVQGTSATRVYV